MSKLPSAPLIEVIFELRWPMDTEAALNEYAYLPGGLYGLLKEQYPLRESLPAVFLPVDQARGLVAHRFRVSAGEHPLVQVGPGVLTVNATDKVYDWGDFEQRSLYVTDTFLKVYPSVNDAPLSLHLLYLDFLPFDFQTHDIQAYLRSTLHISLEQTFFESKEPARGIQLTLPFQTSSGLFTFSVQQANHLDKQGLMLQFSMRHQSPGDLSSIKAWLDQAHAICSKAFRDATQGELYNSFSQQIQ